MRKPSRRKDTTKADVAALAAVMRRADPTPFIYESPGVQAVRIIRCLSGWSWVRADQEAREVAATALRRVGATRPSWQEGQPNFTDARWTTECALCGGLLYGLERHHCSRAHPAETYQRREIGNCRICVIFRGTIGTWRRSAQGLASEKAKSFGNSDAHDPGARPRHPRHGIDRRARGAADAA